MKSVFQSIGVVFTVIVVALLALVSLYVSYLFALGVLLIGLVWVTYRLVFLFNEQALPNSGGRDE